MKAEPGTRIEDYLREHPEKAAKFVELGLPCFVCGEPSWDTIEESCRRHARDVDGVIAALNGQDAPGGRNEAGPGDVKKGKT